MVLFSFETECFNVTMAYPELGMEIRLTSNSRYPLTSACCKADNLSLILKFHIVDGENWFLQALL